jgi:hypothetical protein
MKNFNVNLFTVAASLVLSFGALAQPEEDDYIPEKNTVAQNTPTPAKKLDWHVTQKPTMAFTHTAIVRSNKLEPVQTTMHVSKGDTVFVNATGTISCFEEKKVQVGYAPQRRIIQQNPFSPPIITQPSGLFFSTTLPIADHTCDPSGYASVLTNAFCSGHNKYEHANHGALMILIENKKSISAIQYFDLNEDKNRNVHYFVADQDGTLGFTVNDKDTKNNKGSFSVQCVKK